MVIEFGRFNSGDVKGTITDAVRYHFVPNDVRRHRLISTSYIPLLPCHGRGRGFESRRPRHIPKDLLDCGRIVPIHNQSTELFLCIDFVVVVALRVEVKRCLRLRVSKHRLHRFHIRTGIHQPIAEAVT